MTEPAIAFDCDPHERPARWIHRSSGVQVRQIPTADRSFYTVWKPTPSGTLLFGSADTPAAALRLAREVVEKVQHRRYGPRVLT
jgi:hypothetical protein